MLVKKIIRLCVVLVLSGVSSITFSQSLTFMDALQLIDDEGTAEIPDNYTSIGNEVFKNTGVKKVVLPSTINSIGQSAFENAINLHEINLPSGISSIGQRAFYGTSSLENISIPETVTRIEANTFHNSGIKQISLPSITYIGENAFLSSELESVNLAEDVYIYSDAFNSTKIKDLKIPDGASIDDYTFAYMSDLVSLEIGVNVSILGSNVFKDSGNKLKTIVTSSPIGCYITLATNAGACFNDSNLSNLEYLVFKGDQNTSFFQKISHSGAKIVLQYGSDTSISGSLISSEVIVVSPTVISGPINSSPHSYCSGVDADEDGFPDCYDQFPNDPDRWFDYGDNTEINTINLVHSDSDGLADIFDLSPTSSNYINGSDTAADPEFTIDTDGDGFRNSRDIDDDDDGLLDIYEPFFGTNPLLPDSDFDGAIDGLDAFPLDNTESLDTDSDGIGNNTDTDDDNDGYTDFLDAFPTDATEWADSDLDGIGNNLDSDDDNDGVADTEDAFPHTASESLDSDNDGVGDNADAFPNDSTEVADTDLDGIGNNADPDDDNDGVNDADDGDPLNADIGIQPSQLISVAGNPVGVNGHSTRISLSYDTSDGNNQLPGIGFRVHFNSEMLTYNQDSNNCTNGYDGDDHESEEHHDDHDDHDDHGAGDFHGFCGSEYGSEEDEEHGHEDHESEEHNLLHYVYNSLVVNGDGPYQDDSDFDNDTSTDNYIIFGWAALNGDWPNSSLPASLVEVVFNISWEAFDQASINTPINFSKVSTTEGYNFEATNYTLNVLPGTWDFDGSGHADALTDGLLLLRHTFGLAGEALTNGAVALNSSMTDSDIETAVSEAYVIADIDSNNQVDALTDGLLLLRYLFGLRGDSLVDGAVALDAPRTHHSEIEQYILNHMPVE